MPGSQQQDNITYTETISIFIFLYKDSHLKIKREIAMLFAIILICQYTENCRHSDASGRFEKVI